MKVRFRLSKQLLNVIIRALLYFVRAYLRGPGGICYTQPFTMIPEGTVLEKEKINDVFDISVFLRGFVTGLDWLLFKWNPLVWVFKRYALGIR